MPKQATWHSIPDFDGHEISTDGDIRNKNNKRVMEPSVNQTGVRYVGLRNTKLKSYQNRSISVLVAETFCEGRTTVDDTVLHLDGDIANSKVDNLTWAPRHYVMAYHNQINMEEYTKRKRIVEDGGAIYRSFAHAAMSTASLPSDIKYSVQYNDALSDNTHTNLVHRTSTGHIFRSL